MSDIIERLRFIASGQDDPHSVALTQAADEIEHLRDCLAQAVKAIEWQEGKRPHNLSTIGRAYWRARWALAR